MSSQDGQKRAVERLIAIAGMLGSDHEGERANAARLATVDLRRMGLSWRDLIERAFRVLEAPPQREAVQEGWEPQQAARPKPGMRTSRRDGLCLWDIIRHASLRPQAITAWEQTFVQSFLKIGPKCKATEAQWRIVLQIAEKLEMAA